MSGSSAVAVGKALRPEDDDQITGLRLGQILDQRLAHVFRELIHLGLHALRLIPRLEDRRDLIPSCRLGGGVAPFPVQYFGAGLGPAVLRGPCPRV